MLTQAQVDLLAWLVEVDSQVVFVGTGFSDPEGDVLIAHSGPRRQISGSDFRELETRGFVRHVSGSMYELTNEGRNFHQELGEPPPDLPPLPGAS